MKIYTKMGDQGDTGLFGGPRVRKDHVRIEAYGTIDELNALLGLARGEDLPTPIRQLLARVQHQLLTVGSQLAAPEPPKGPMPAITTEHVSQLEQAIDQFDRQLPPLTQFILPAGTRAASTLHVARTVCRRAERRAVSLSRIADQHVAPPVLAYLNRLSDLLFVLARAANAAAGQPDIAWQKP